MAQISNDTFVETLSAFYGGNKMPCAIEFDTTIIIELEAKKDERFDGEFGSATVRNNPIKSQLNWLLDIFDVDTTAASRIRIQIILRNVYFYWSRAANVRGIKSQATEATSHLRVQLKYKIRTT